VAGEDLPVLTIEQARLPEVRLLLAALFNPLTEWAWDWLLGWGLPRTRYGGAGLRPLMVSLSNHTEEETDMGKGQGPRSPIIPNHPDKGCRLYPSCLSCPRPRCIHDEIDGAGRPYSLSDHDKALALERTRAGASPQELAAAFGVNRHTIARALQTQDSGLRPPA
jgi:hypothetical protein